MKISNRCFHPFLVAAAAGLLFLSGRDLSAGAYFRAGHDGYSLGNAALERVFERDSSVVRSAWLINHLSGHTWRTGSEEFRLDLTFERLGYWPGLENPLSIGASDCVFRGYRVETPPAGGRRLVLQYHWEQGLTGEGQSADGDSPGLEIEVAYTVGDSLPEMHKQVSLRCTAGEMYFLESISVEDMFLPGADCLNQGFGQPVYTREMFFGLEYPAGENTFAEDRLRLACHPGVAVGREGYTSYSAVWGVAARGATRAAFLAYVDRIRYAPARPFLLYNTWYDLRTPERAEGNAGGFMNLQNSLARVRLFKQELVDKGIPLKSFVLDEGWDRYTPFWEIDRKNFPDGFKSLSRALKDMNSGLGLWLGPIGGYGEGLALRSAGGRKAGLEVSAKGYLDLAGPRYNRIVTDRLLEYIKDYDINYYKFDGVLYGYAGTDHGMLPGIYARERQTAALAALCDTLHAARPGIFLNVTTSQWLSPWWLQHADCVFMGGGDFGWLGALPSASKRDLAISYRDKVCWDQFVRCGQQFPLNSIMTVGVIKGEYELLGERDETLDKWTNNLVMHFGRGVSMWELYISPQILKEPEWKSLRGALRWATDNRRTLLANTTVLGGDPAERNPYGYFHQGPDKLILVVRNPYVEPTAFSLRLDSEHGVIRPLAGAWLPVTVYPYKEFGDEWLSAGEAWSVGLEGYETKVIEFWPAARIDFPVPLDVRFEVGPGGLTLFPEDTSGVLIENCSAATLELNGISLAVGSRGRVPLEDFPPAGALKVSESHGGAGLAGELSLEIPGVLRSSDLAFVVESVDSLPEIKLVLNSPGGRIECHSLQGEGGRWCWFNAPLDSAGAQKVRYDLKTGSALPGRAELSAWLITQREIPGRQLKLPGLDAALDSAFSLPAESALKREITCLFRRPLQTGGGR